MIVRVRILSLSSGLFPHRTEAGLKFHVAASAGIVKVGGGQKNLGTDNSGLEACDLASE